MSTPSVSPDPAKIQKFREVLHQEWTGDRTVAAWRKWHARIATFTRGATEAIVEGAHLRPGMRVLYLANAAGEIKNAHPRSKMRTLNNSFSGATGKCGNPGVPFPPRGDRPVARPFLMKNLTKLLDLCGIGRNTRRAHGRPLRRPSLAD